MIRIIGLLLVLISQVAIASDTLWSETELRIIESLSINQIPKRPISPSNQFANNALAQELGKKLFFDTQFSGNKQLSCASCHQPDKFFTDGLPLARGLHATGRNTPTVVGSAWQRWFYWDGRKDSLWSQALIPFEAPNEMGGNRVSVVNTIFSDKQYRETYENLFGPFPKTLKHAELTLEAGPIGTKVMQSRWKKLNKETQESIDRVYVNIGKSLAAYQRTLSYQATSFDHYAAQLKENNNSNKKLKKNANKSLLTDDQIAGLKLFINPEKTSCLQCHNSALFTNRGFHNVGSGTFSGASLDFGRMLGLQAVLLDEFNCLGPYSDANPSECTSLNYLNRRQHIPLKGAFKTPGLRNLRSTSPYFHDGRFKSLEEVVNFYNNPPTDNGPHELSPLGLTREEVSQLVHFLDSLN